MKSLMPLLVALVAALAAAPSAVDAAVISSTFDQDGSVKVADGFGGLQVRTGTGVAFTSPGGPYAPFTHVRFRGWINFAGASTPELILTDPTDLFLLSGIPTGLFVHSTQPTAIVEVQSPWVNLSPTLGAQLAALVNGNPSINVWLRSPSSPDFNNPASLTTFNPDFTPSTYVYTATLQFLTVPEPSSLLAWGTLLIPYSAFRRRRRDR